MINSHVFSFGFCFWVAACQGSRVDPKFMMPSFRGLVYGRCGLVPVIFKGRAYLSSATTDALVDIPRIQCMCLHMTFHSNFRMKFAHLLPSPVPICSVEARAPRNAGALRYWFKWTVNHVCAWALHQCEIHVQQHGIRCCAVASSACELVFLLLTPSWLQFYIPVFRNLI